MGATVGRSAWVRKGPGDREARERGRIRMAGEGARTQGCGDGHRYGHEGHAGSGLSGGAVEHDGETVGRSGGTG